MRGANPFVLTSLRSDLNPSYAANILSTIAGARYRLTALALSDAVVRLTSAPPCQVERDSNV